MRYDFKAIEEITWAMVIAGGIFAFEVLSKFDPSVITDWETWSVSLVGGLVRAVFAGGMIALRQRFGSSAD